MLIETQRTPSLHPSNIPPALPPARLLYVFSCFFPFSLRTVATSFDLPVAKGDFPHRFNTMTNFTYTGDIPDPDYYGVEDMNPTARQSFMEWHTSQRDKVFDFQKEMLDYCRRDVEILRLACTFFRQIIMSMTSDSFDEKTHTYSNAVDPYVNVTLASLCLDIFRSKFLKEETVLVEPTVSQKKKQVGNKVKTQSLPPDTSQTEPNDIEDVLHVELDDVAGELAPPTQSTKGRVQFESSPIGIVPAGGYTRQDSFSKKSILWLELIGYREGIRIQHAMNGGEFQIPETNYHSDGVCFETQTLYEYFGCLWHACPTCFPPDKKTCS